MPRKVQINAAKILPIFQKFRAEVFNQSTKSIPIPSDPIWSIISNELLLDNVNISARHCYTIVRQDRYNVWQHLGIIGEAMQNTPSSETSVDESSSESSENDENTLIFEIEFSFEQFSSLIDRVDYARGDSRGSTRTYSILKPRHWTNVIHNKFYQATHFPCAISYKHNRILPEGGVYLTINGKCTDCNSEFLGQIYEKPNDKTSLVMMECEYHGPFRQCAAVSKRKLIGPRKKIFLKKMLKEKKSGPYIRGEFARRNLEYGEREPSQLPTSNALRCAKYKEKKKKLVADNPVYALCLLKGDVMYQEIIHDIAVDRFNIHYWANEEVQNYRLLSRQSKTPTLCIDATGSVVRKINHLSQKKSSHIFLYEMVAHDREKNIQFSVAHMLSEKHDNVTISAWLSEWLRSTGAAGPKIVVTDGSLALMYSVTRSFTQHSTLASYLTTCFRLLHGDKIDLPSCMIRQDVNHIMHTFSRWDAFKRNHHPRFKKFYLKSLAILITSINYEEALQLISKIFVISLFEYQDSKEFSAAKDFLLKKISGCSDSIKKVLETCDDFSEALVCEEEEILESITEANSFSEEIQNLFDEVNRKKNKVLSESDEESEINALYCPDIAKKLLVTCKYIPLWSAVMVPIFKYGHLTETSASVECAFKDLKHTTFKHIELPIRVDEFVKKHIDSIIGAAILKKSDYLRNNFKQTNTDITEQSGSEIDDPSSCEESRNQPFKKSQESEQQAEDSPKQAVKNSSQTAIENRRSLTQETDTKEKMLSYFHITSKKNTESKSLSPIIGVLKNGPDNTLQSVNQLSNKLEECEQQAEKLAIENSSETAIENWRNLAQETRKKKKTYFDKDGVFQTLNFESKSLSPVIGVLKNGLDSTLQSIQIEGKYYRFPNTCTFDSLIQSMCVAYADSLMYQSYVNTLATNHLLFRLISDMIRHGINRDTYRKRAKIILNLKAADGKEVFAKKPAAVPKSYTVNTESTAAYLVNNLFRQYPSLSETRTCNICNNEMKRNRVFITINLPSFQIKDQQQLSALIDDALKCGNKICDTKTCRSTDIESIYDVGHHLLVDINTPGQQETFDETLTTFDLTTTLSTIPVLLNIADMNFMLRSCISFIPSPGGIGHYIAYCHRENGIWEVYDDLSKLVKRYDDTHTFIRKNNVRLSFLIYSK